jgi:hypothetical protein
MNRAAGGFALIALLMGGIVSAQTPAQSTPSPSTMPSTQDPSSTGPSTSQPAPNAGARSETKMQLKDCIALQRANNPQLSQQDALKACKDAASSSPRD